MVSQAGLCIGKTPAWLRKRKIKLTNARFGSLEFARAFWELQSAWQAPNFRHAGLDMFRRGACPECGEGTEASRGSCFRASGNQGAGRCIQAG
eukprot:11111880-Heterocapsa_arctica.AAC.1